MVKNIKFYSRLHISTYITVTLNKKSSKKALYHRHHAAYSHLLKVPNIPFKVTDSNNRQ